MRRAHPAHATARASCTRGSQQLAKDAGLAGKVRINKSGCLDQCEHGPTVVVYPDAVWYGNVQPEDAEDIVSEHLIAGRPVERLRIADECLNTKSCPHPRLVANSAKRVPMFRCSFADSWMPTARPRAPCYHPSSLLPASPCTHAAPCGILTINP